MNIVVLVRQVPDSGAEVTVVSMGPDSALDVIRKVLAMGVDRRATSAATGRTAPTCSPR